MPQPFLTIGMATYDDYYGVWPTIQGLKLYHPLEEVEIIVVDNNPGGPHAQAIQNLIQRWSAPYSIRYVAFGEQKGTSPPRNKVFEEAEGEFVLCCDSHVLFAKDSIERLIAFYKENRDTKDLYSGPMLYDDIHSMETHFDLVWRAEMWGIWSHAWRCEGCEQMFCVRGDQSGKSTFHRLADGVELFECGCGKRFPDIPYAGHQRMLSQDYSQPAKDPTSPPFEIPAQGLGVFTCAREAWLGFHPDARGFGGEEGYIHEKFRQAGRKCWCLPFLGWNHRYGRPDGHKYPFDLYGKVRNYVLEFMELGRPLDEIYQHFVVELSKLSAPQWKGIVMRPKDKEVSKALRGENAMVEKFAKQPDTIEVQPKLPKAVKTIPDMFQWLAGVPRNVDQHLHVMQGLAASCKSVTELSRNRETTIALLSAFPAELVSWQREKDIILYHAHDMLAEAPEDQMQVSYELYGNQGHNVSRIAKRMKEGDGTDFLFLDTDKTAARTLELLSSLSSMVRRYILIYGTESWGVTGEGPNQAGLLPGIKKWMDEVADAKRWRVIVKRKEQHGIVLLSAHAEDLPRYKIHLWPPGYGPGSVLRTRFKKLGFKETKNCRCNWHASVMDMEGPFWCQENIDTILEWLKTETVRRGGKWNTVKAIAAKRIVLSSIKKSLRDPRVKADMGENLR